MLHGPNYEAALKAGVSQLQEIATKATQIKGGLARKDKDYKKVEERLNAAASALNRESVSAFHLSVVKTAVYEAAQSMISLVTGKSVDAKKLIIEFAEEAKQLGFRVRPEKPSRFKSTLIVSKLADDECFVDGLDDSDGGGAGAYGQCRVRCSLYHRTRFFPKRIL
jgi:hypothetical protein